MVEITNFNKVKHIFSKWKYDMALDSIAIGNTLVRLWVDDETNPSCVLCLKDIRMRMNGYPQDDKTLTAVKEFLKTLPTITEEVIFFWYEKEWEQLINDVYQYNKPWKAMREYYVIDTTDLVANQFTHKYNIKDVKDVINDDYQDIDVIKEEMCSESDSIDAFLKNCFGFVMVVDNKIIGYCLSEYNNPLGCEVGIGVNKDYRRQQIATTLGQRLLEEAKNRGLKTVGWGCFKENLPSVKTAKKLGFTKVKEFLFVYIKF